MTDETPQYFDQQDLMEWMEDVDSRLSKLNLTQMVAGGLALAAFGMAGLGLAVTKKLLDQLEAGAKQMQLAAAQQAPSQQEAPVNIEQTFRRPAEVIDETKSVPEGTAVAAPYEAPGATEASDRVRELMASDPLSPADLLARERREV